MTDVLTPEQIAAEAQAAYENGDYLEAAQSYQAAEQSYRLAGDMLNAAESANNCCVSLLRAGQAKEALAAVKGTIEIFEQAGDVRRQAMALGNQATALEAAKQTDAALEDYQKSADLFKQIGENELYTSTMQALSALQLRSGRQLEALATMKAGVEKIERPGLKTRFLKKLLDIPFRLFNR
jgi:tetratricopeptide (TPR) repeat protein